MIVFSKGDWIDVPLPKGYDPCWSKADKYYYATVWAACVDKFPSEKAETLAEAAVIKRMYPEISFQSALEAELKMIFD